MIGEHEGSGDKLARGARSATFVGPRMKINEGEMRDDLVRLDKQSFCDKYLVTSREYLLLTSPRAGEADEAASNFLEERRKAWERETEAETRHEAKLVSRDCFIIPAPRRLIVLRDGEHKPRARNIVLVDDPRKRKLLPTTGHVIACADDCSTWMGKRVLFGQMSGTAICFNGMPDWIMLQVEEIMGEVLKEDAQLAEQELEAMV